MYDIKVAEIPEDIARCYPVMAQLRPHISAEDFIPTVKEQMKDAYRLVYLSEGNEIAAVAGFRINNNLAWGKHVYVDDLITDQHKRSRGIGNALLSWLIKEAKNNDCSQLHLDSAIQRKDAHRFYEKEGMQLASYHYVIRLQET